MIQEQTYHFFALNGTFKNFALQYCLQELIKNPFEIVFNDSIKIDDYVILNLEYGLGNGKRDKVSLIPKISFITDIYLKEEINIGPNEPDVSTTLFDNFFIKYSEEFLNQYWITIDKILVMIMKLEIIIMIE